MRLHFYLFLASLAVPINSLLAQSPPEQGLTAYYSFDGNLEDITGTSNNLGEATGPTAYDCGVVGRALRLDGDDNYVSIPGATSTNVNREFDQEDFTVSLYFKPTGNLGSLQTLISKRDTGCNNLQFFAVQYTPPTSTLTVIFRQNNQLAMTSHQITNEFCWQNVVVARNDNRIRLFLNGEEVDEVRTTTRVDITNAGRLTIGGGNCPGQGERTFEGLIDEVRVYNRALTSTQVQSLYFAPDRIITAANRIFLGESIDFTLNSNCGTNFQWSPTEGIDDPEIPEPTITPTAAGTRSYTVTISDDQSTCVATDSVTVQVVDPAELDCSQVFLPKAFTPNGIGPVANETFGISNPFAVSELLSFEIYDRYGGQMFQTTDAFARWDGTFKGEPVAPGVVVWRAVFRCDGEEKVESGTVMVLR